MRRQRSDISHCHFVNDFGGEKEKNLSKKMRVSSSTTRILEEKVHPFLKTYNVFMIYIVFKDNHRF